jgi:hypothetical protein
MIVRLIADVLEKVHDLTSGQKLLLICLANYANDKGECWPSIASLAAQADVTTRHVSGMLHDLAKLGYLSIQEHSGKSNSYTLQVAQPTNPSSGVKQASGVNPSSGDPRTTVPPPTNPSSGVPTNPSSGKPSYRTVKEPSSEPSEKARAKNASQLPVDFEVTFEMESWAIKEGIAVAAIEPETAKFRDYHRAKGSTMKDWPAAWRNWMRNSLTFNKRSSNGRASPQMSNAEQSKAAIRRAAGQQAPEPVGPVYETTGRIQS